jgi:hypothetical protein
MPYLFAVFLLNVRVFLLELSARFRAASAIHPFLYFASAMKALKKENPFGTIRDPSFAGVRAASLMAIDAIDNECFALVATIVLWTGVDCLLYRFDKLLRRLFPFHDCASFSSGFADVLRM